jgi:hypothetical protein
MEGSFSTSVHLLAYGVLVKFMHQHIDTELVTEQALHGVAQAIGTQGEEHNITLTC